ncbi:MAG: hypothetical protein HFH10_02185 [Dorea sp.]|nr:hypothetical protein [Dorea sp.]
MRKRLSDLCVFYSGTGFPMKYQGKVQDELPFYKVGDIANNVVQGNVYLKMCKNYISETEAKEIKGTIIPPNTVVFAKIGEALRLNRRAITTERCLIDNNAMGIAPLESEISLKYFYYFMCNLKMESFAESTTVPSVRKSKLEEKEIDLPSMQEQHNIEKVLDEISTLIQLSKTQLEQYDVLIKSRFVELFGDPMANPKGFNCYTVGDVIEFQGGSQPDKKYFEYEPTEDNIRLIQIRDYKSDKYITYIPRTMAKRFCTTDDIMIGRYGPPIFQILKGIEGSFNVALMKATPRKGNREFIRQFLKQDCLLEYLEGLSKRTAGQDGIQMDKLKAYPFPYPPIELQEQFATFVKHIDKLKVESQKSLEKTQMLFNSLMQQYFG